MARIIGMKEMWTYLDAHTVGKDGTVRSVNHLNEWGGMSRRLGLPVFTAWRHLTSYDKDTRMSRALIGDAEGTAAVGVRNQEIWIDKAFEEFAGRAAFFVIHAKDLSVDPWKIESLESDRVFIGQLHREGSKTYLNAQPRDLLKFAS
jgi:hypothetical protein